MTSSFSLLCLNTFPILICSQSRFCLLTKCKSFKHCNASCLQCNYTSRLNVWLLTEWSVVASLKGVSRGYLIMNKCRLQTFSLSLRPVAWWICGILLTSDDTYGSATLAVSKTHHLSHITTSNPLRLADAATRQGHLGQGERRTMWAGGGVLRPAWITPTSDPARRVLIKWKTTQALSLSDPFFCNSLWWDFILRSPQLIWVRKRLGAEAMQFGAIAFLFLFYLSLTNKSFFGLQSLCCYIRRFWSPGHPVKLLK